jgi:glycosyltransferase involved in cell wall biosynthesis
MKIGHVTYRCRPAVGGMENYVAQLFDVLAAAGYSQRIYQVDAGIHAPELRFVPRPPLLPKQVGFNLGLLACWPQLCREDALVVSNPEHYLPVAWHRSAIVLSHGATWTADASPRRRGLRRWATELAYRRARTCVYNDTFVPRELGLDAPAGQRLFEQIAPGRWIIPNCVDTHVFRPNNGLESLRRLEPVLVPRNLTYPRGVDLAIKAFARFVGQYPQTNLVIVGDLIYDHLREFRYKLLLNQLIQELDMVGKVYFLGNVPRAHMPRVYGSASLTVIPTRRSEGTSLAALESMACGVPTVSTGVEGLLDLPTVKCQVDAESMAAVMAQTFQHAQEVAGDQHADVHKRFNLDNWQQAWLRVIDGSGCARRP